MTTPLSERLSALAENARREYVRIESTLGQSEWGDGRVEGSRAIYEQVHALNALATEAADMEQRVALAVAECDTTTDYKATVLAVIAILKGDSDE